MKSLLRAGATTLALVTLAIACADSEETTPTSVEADGGATPLQDASPDAEVDARVDAGTDAAPPRECSDDGFCHTAVAKNHVLRGVWGDGAGAVWTVSELGSIFRWDGTQWTAQATRLGVLTTVWGSSSTDVWVGGQQGLFHGTGASPQALTFVQVPGLLGEITSIWGTSASDIWAVLIGPEAPSVLHYANVDGQLAWSTVTVGTPNSRFNRVWGGAGTGVWLAGLTFDEETFFDKGEVYRMRPGTSEFELLDMPHFPDMEQPYWAFGEVVDASIASGTEMVLQARAISGDAMIIRGSSYDGGQTFTFNSEVDGTYQDPTTLAIRAFAQDDLWTVGDYGRVRHWDGTDWTQMAVTNTKYPLVAPMFGMWAKGPDDFWIVGDNVALHFDPTKKR